MFTLIIGGAASGKSEYAESYVSELSGKKIYLATMEPFGQEAEARIVRHRAMRSQKGFLTAEQYTGIGNADLPPDANVLLEDLGNLLANEMYSPSGSGTEAVLGGVSALLEKCRHLTIVTNEVGSGGADHERETLQYMEDLGRINCVLAACADRVTEVVCGLPRVRKEAADVAD